MQELGKEDASYMADNDDKREDGSGHKKTLTLKGAPNLGGRPGMSRSSRSTVVVEKRTRVVPPRGPGAHGAAPSASPRPHPTQPNNSGAPQQRQQPRSPQPGGRPAGGLSSTEAEARQRALREAAARQAEDDVRRRAEEARRAEEDARRAAVREEAQREEDRRAA